MRKITIEVPDTCEGCRFLSESDPNDKRYFAECTLFEDELYIDYYRPCKTCLENTNKEASGEN